MQWVGLVPELGEVLTHYHQGRAASGGALAPEPPRAHWRGPELCGMRYEGSVMDKVVRGETLPSHDIPVPSHFPHILDSPLKRP